MIVVFGDNALHALGGSDVERGIHHGSGEFDVRTRSQREGAERNDGEFVVHLTLVERETSRESHFAFGRHAQI